jgi:hypothetical protein
MGEKNEKKCIDHGREKWETKFVRELASEYYSSKLVSENFLVKVMRLLEVVF